MIARSARFGGPAPHLSGQRPYGSQILYRHSITRIAEEKANKLTMSSPWGDDRNRDRPFREKLAPYGSGGRKIWVDVCRIFAREQTDDAEPRDS